MWFVCGGGVCRCGARVGPRKKEKSQPPALPLLLTLPAAPPCPGGSWHVTHSVCTSCVFPVRYSPYTSVMHLVSMPPPRMASTAAAPVDTRSTSRARVASTARAVVQEKPEARERAASSSLSILASDRPLMSARCWWEGWRGGGVEGRVCGEVRGKRGRVEGGASSPLSLPLTRLVVISSDVTVW